MERVLITGASRGIGFEFAREYAERGARVFAGFRRRETAGKLIDLRAARPEQVTMVALDVSDEESIRRSRDTVAEATGALDVLVNNAGIPGFELSTGQQERLGTFHFEDSWLVFRTMGVGPLLMAQEYLELLKKGSNPVVANVTSGYGSVSSNTHRFPYYYSAAKSAMHQLMRSLAADVRPMGIRVVLLDPGSVRTDMGGPTAPLSPEESVGGMIRVIDSLSLENTNSFISWQGKQCPW